MAKLRILIPALLLLLLTACEKYTNLSFEEVTGAKLPPNAKIIREGNSSYSGKSIVTYHAHIAADESGFEALCGALNLERVVVQAGTLPLAHPNDKEFSWWRSPDVKMQLAAPRFRYQRAEDLANFDPGLEIVAQFHEGVIWFFYQGIPKVNL